MDMSTNHENDKAAKADREQLAAVRVAVDEVDEQIVSLIGRRERLIRIAGTLKADSAVYKDVAQSGMTRARQVNGD